MYGALWPKQRHDANVFLVFLEVFTLHRGTFLMSPNPFNVHLGKPVLWESSKILDRTFKVR